MVGSLPLIPVDFVMKGEWELKDGKPVWTWFYFSGNNQSWTPVQVACHSTFRGSMDLFVNDCVLKALQPYTFFKLKEPPKEQIIKEIYEWVSCLGLWFGTRSSETVHSLTHWLVVVCCCAQ